MQRRRIRCTSWWSRDLRHFSPNFICYRCHADCFQEKISPILTVIETLCGCTGVGITWEKKWRFRQNWIGIRLGRSVSSTSEVPCNVTDRYGRCVRVVTIFLPIRSMPFFSFVVTFYTLDTVLLSKPTITRTIQAIELLFEGKPVNALDIS